MRLDRSCSLIIGLVLSGCGPGAITSNEGGETGTASGTTLSTASGTTLGTSDSSEPNPTTADTDPSGGPDWGSDDITDEGGWDLGKPPVLDMGVPPDPGLPNGASCTADLECGSDQCLVIPFLGGQCGECNEDSDCPNGGCSPHNPFGFEGSVCNLGEYGAGCETDLVCQDGLTCSTALDLLGLIQLNSCGDCVQDFDCGDGEICAAIVEVSEFSGVRTCIPTNSLPTDAYCDLESNGDQACQSGICTIIDIMGIAQIGACGECNSDAECGGGTCVLGSFELDTGVLTGATCQ